MLSKALLAVTTIAGLSLLTTDLTAPVAAGGKVKVQSVNRPAPKIRIRPKPPKVRVRVNTKRLVKPPKPETALTLQQSLTIQKIAVDFWRHGNQRLLQKHWDLFVRGEAKSGRLTNHDQARRLANEMVWRIRRPAPRKNDSDELANIDLQSKQQTRQQNLQTMSNIAKLMHDSAMAVVRKIGD